MKPTQFISAVILLSPDSRRLADFYREGLGVPLEADQHDEGGIPHFECQLGDLHFAVHPLDAGSAPLAANAARVQRIKFAFAVTDLDETLHHLRSLKTEPLYSPQDRGFARMTAIHDPDGNLIELTQLSDSWLRHLNSRSKDQRDIVENLSAAE